ncbi:MAG: PHP domain-containing protein [Clostridiales bacterium]|nr:PHP domain-containing protein [Clostridiales bacterium]
MKCYYDFHLHSCLSPCGDNDMTPYNLVNMAKLLGYDIIALTDHNTCLNCPSAIEAGKKAGIEVVAGMELCSSEEIHIVCLFPKLENALDFSDYVHNHIPPVKNKKEIFGDQLIMDGEDNVKGEEELLLTTASDISVDNVHSLVEGYGGVSFPAHIDRSSYSVISVLGAIYPELNFSTAELTPKADVEKYKRDFPLLNEMKIVHNSDAHYLENMLESEFTIELKECNAKSVIEYFK